MQELRAENMAIKEISDHRQVDIQRLKNELNLLNDNNQKIGNERFCLENELNLGKEERMKLLDEIDMLT